ncbi:hypothetical protein EY643_02240 [Halioglobus maricola]|uniref:Uncharacterized protein n=1 Tax=Halioglobus maricola TaxID=2601894 RepID=A0A5P9NFJ3_9GAMM|nr:hypothetical protein [Halioglobus maricola]QFU74563.1 hypothetical protein EY643_02240 [Halioglobus maricola]
MKRSNKHQDGSCISEMAIVDTFTKLIFGEEDRYTHRELRIIQAFRAVDTNVVLDSHRDMGAYLRALGVQEMIRLVTRVQGQLVDGEPVMAEVAAMEQASKGALGRRVH